ncbi:RluA family pseudouridine synthase [Coraliomargarita akajimensis]|uniref:Pseudouridine synthase n=1 Tax=Coraliomargarita akajimensis (strain DSM 45221 / IAM 15411 / JCM 23193 / KCTC 12865 / 04OKA010-24) TaxID=583355 RepID=D5EIX6_CORAD|nr:pseudouridine synthase [Coraliomargarita akajimensis]ADE54375.1 pseudouridine synthase [Coraliomargarita akajimensis DSM 45221]
MPNPTDLPTALEWLAKQYPDSPKKRLKEWFAQGRVTLDGEVITKPHLRLEDPGKRLSMGKPQQVPNVVFKRLPIRIHAQVNLLYIDNSLAIVNKGPGLLSVPLPGKNQPSALKILESYFKGKGASELERNRVDRATLTPLPVHRLDQYTSGLLCFAMTPQAREHLVKQVRDHSFIREYMALADGWVDPRRGTWRSWFKLDKEGMQQAVFDEPTEGATEAISHYEVIDSISWPTRDGKKQTVSRLKLRLETGLKHQLRIHSARAGCPLLGDRHYNPDFKKAAEANTGQPYGCKRQALHASHIGFVHPETGKTKRFSSKFPRDLVELEERLREKAKS